MNKKDIVDAWAWIRKNNQAIPDDVLDLMKDAAIEKLSSHAPEVKGDWEIVSFIEKDEEVEEGDEPFILPVSTIPSCYKLEMYLAADSCFNIHSVKRTIEGEVFTLGDNCFHGPIVRFNLRDNQITADFECGDVGCSVLLSELSKPLQRIPLPLFKTEDGVDIFEGMGWWSLFTNRNWELQYNNPIEHTHNPDFKGIRFSTSEAAKEYVILNKPCLSVNDVIKAFEDWKHENEFFEDYIKQFAKQKLDKQ